MPNLYLQRMRQLTASRAGQRGARRMQRRSGHIRHSIRRNRRLRPVSRGVRGAAGGSSTSCFETAPRSLPGSTSNVGATQEQTCSKRTAEGHCRGRGPDSPCTSIKRACRNSAPHAASFWAHPFPTSQRGQNRRQRRGLFQHERSYPGEAPPRSEWRMA